MKQLLHAITSGFSGMQTKRVMMQFSRKVGLVYFGDIDRVDNDERLVRGITLAAPGKDQYYCFGAHDSYDIACVQRIAKIHPPSHRSTNHSWIVMQFDLHTASPLPHILIGHRNEAEMLYGSLLSTERDLTEHIFATPTDHHKQFPKQFITLAPQAHAQMVEYIVSPEFTGAVIGHFRHLLIEIEGDSLYLFVDDARPSVHFLDKMLHYGLVFAKHIDERMGAR